MRFNLILALVVAIVATASAQKFSPGYYITTSGDTVKRDLQLQQKNGFISKVATPEGLFLAPKDLLGFGVNDVNYVVRKVSMDKTPTGGFVIDTVFLEVMNRGKISLFYMIDENDKVHFYIENENGPQELTVRLNSQNGDIAVRKVETYKSVLKGVFPTCTDLFGTIDKTLFSRKGIQSIYEKLYKCRYQEAAPVMKTEKRNTSSELGVFGGISMTNIDFKYTNSNPSTETAIVSGLNFSKKSIDPTGGIYFETKFARGNIVSLRHELSYYQYTQTSNEFKFDPYQTNSYTGYVNASYVKYSIIARAYLLRNSSIKPFLNVGLSPMVAVSISAELERKGTIVPPPGFYQMFNKTQSFTTGYFGGIGVAYLDFALELRYERAGGVNQKDIDSPVKALNFVLSYRITTFGKKQK